MKFKIQKLDGLCGKRATVYSVILNDDEHTLFEQFIMDNNSEYQEELASLKNQLTTMAHKVGVREQFFRRPEGKIGQDVWDLRDNPKNHLRLYCIKLSNVAIILGGGGAKPKGVIKFQEIPKLEYENSLMRMVSDALYKRILDKEIRWSSDGCELMGNLIFEDDSFEGDD